MAKALKNAKANRKPHGSDLDPDKRVDLNGVTPKEEQFCQVYLIEFSILKASQAAGITSNTGQAWMIKPNIQKRIAQIRNDVSKSLDLTRERMLQRLMQIIYGDPRKFFSKSGKITKPDTWDDDTAAIINGIKVNIIGDVESVKQIDQLKAIELVNKMMGYNAPEVKKIDLMPTRIDKEEIIEMAKLFDKYL